MQRCATNGMVPFEILEGAIGLKDVAVTVPQAATVGDTVTLQCRYNLEGEPLYTVKWYKGQSEFYRFLPKELPNTQVFPLPGIDVDVRSFMYLNHLLL
ncbi:hypothetical protein FQA39_LY14968 [Lamprigera yunnana]|nr:hypothetical protein FQA39_LY14968 [Lamprigera yunnana]